MPRLVAGDPTRAPRIPHYRLPSLANEYQVNELVLPRRSLARLGAHAHIAGTAFFFVALFAQPMRLLVADWWNDPDAGHGLLLVPLALGLAWRAGALKDRRPAAALGIAFMIAAVLLRVFAELAAELFTMRLSIIGALMGLVVFHAGLRQLYAWWLPFSLLVLSIPLPEVVLGSVTLPLQMQASKLGAALLETRHVPVLVSGNVIRLPGQELFVSEACSGLRSLTALLSLGVLLGGMLLRHPVSRVALIICAVPIAVAGNAIRVFLTGFVVFHISPEAGQGFLHYTEGWLLFVGAFITLAAVAWAGGRLERTLGIGGRRAL